MIIWKQNHVITPSVSYRFVDLRPAPPFFFSRHVFICNSRIQWFIFICKVTSPASSTSHSSILSFFTLRVYFDLKQMWTPRWGRWTLGNLWAFNQEWQRPRSQGKGIFGCQDAASLPACTLAAFWKSLFKGKKSCRYWGPLKDLMKINNEIKSGERWTTRRFLKELQFFWHFGLQGKGFDSLGKARVEQWRHYVA